MERALFVKLDKNNNVLFVEWLDVLKGTTPKGYLEVEKTRYST